MLLKGHCIEIAEAEKEGAKGKSGDKRADSMTIEIGGRYSKLVFLEMSET